MAVWLMRAALRIFPRMDKCGLNPLSLSHKKKGLCVPQLVDIGKLGLNSKIKKFSYSFICGKGYFPPEGGRIAFCLQSEPETLGFRRRE